MAAEFAFPQRSKYIAKLKAMLSLRPESRSYNAPCTVDALSFMFRMRLPRKISTVGHHGMNVVSHD